MLVVQVFESIKVGKVRFVVHVLYLASGVLHDLITTDNVAGQARQNLCRSMKEIAQVLKHALRVAQRRRVGDEIGEFAVKQIAEQRAFHVGSIPIGYILDVHVNRWILRHGIWSWKELHELEQRSIRACEVGSFGRG
jgi:hypothetical protein